MLRRLHVVVSWLESSERIERTVLMRLMLGQALVDAHPDLTATLAELGEVGVLNTFALGPSTVAALDAFRPDLVMGSRLMLDLGFLFRNYLDQAGFGDVPIVLGDVRPSAATKVRTAHAGFQDIVDLGSAPDEVRAAVASAGRRRFGLVDDPIWSSITRPTHDGEIHIEARDSVDAEILALIAIGLSDQEIAEAVYMSSQTVRNRISQMLIRSGLTNRTQMAWIFTHQNLLRIIRFGTDHADFEVSPPE